MFDIGAGELLVIVIIAIIVIGPKDMPLAMRTAGRWIGKVRRVSAHFRSGVDAMIREAELEEMDRKWREQNERIMAKYPSDPGTGEGVSDAANPDTDGLPKASEGSSAESKLGGEMTPLPPPPPSAGEAPPTAAKAQSAEVAKPSEPSLPFDEPKGEG